MKWVGGASSSPLTRKSLCKVSVAPPSDAPRNSLGETVACGRLLSGSRVRADCPRGSAPMLRVSQETASLLRCGPCDGDHRRSPLAVLATAGGPGATARRPALRLRRASRLTHTRSLSFPGPSRGTSPHGLGGFSPAGSGAAGAPPGAALGAPHAAVLDLRFHSCRGFTPFAKLETFAPFHVLKLSVPPAFRDSARSVLAPGFRGFDRFCLSVCLFFPGLSRRVDPPGSSSLLIASSHLAAQPVQRGLVSVPCPLAPSLPLGRQAFPAHRLGVLRPS